MNETKEQRIERQARQHRQMVKEMKLDVEKSYKMKVLHDAYYKQHDFKETVEY
jgi:hypothetical protein